MIGPPPVTDYITPLRAKVKPDSIPRLRIAVDPGHGGSDGGTVDPVSGLPEKVAALQLALSLKHYLSRAGHSVTLTRSGDTYPTLGERLAVARANECDLFLSVHFDWSKGRSMVITDDEDAQLGQHLASLLRVPAFVTGAEDGDGYVRDLYIDKAAMPAVIWEVDAIPSYVPDRAYRVERAAVMAVALESAVAAGLLPRKGGG